MKRILIVDDDPTNVLIVKRVLSDQGYSISEATNGEEALHLHTSLPFDMIITDWMMPVMDGLTLIPLVRLRRLGDPIIILITSLIIEGAKERAIMCGADIYLPKPLIPQIVRKTVEDGFRRKDSNFAPVKTHSFDIFQPKVSFSAVGIASSTGGPAALVELFKNISIDERFSCFIVQHGPAWMIETFAKSLANLTHQEIILPSHLEEVRPGKIYLAPGDVHVTIDPDNLKFKFNDDHPENFVKPSADPLFASIAAAFGIKSIGVLLTGMGCDGVAGALKIKASGGMVIAQDPVEAIVPAMPLSILELGLGVKSFKLKAMDRQIQKRLNEINLIA
jgi:two-component system chemotaxis response regulator CheB